MEEEDQAASKCGINAVDDHDRNDKGQFVNGNSHTFEKGHKPVSPGRPKSRIITREIEKWLDKPASSLEVTRSAAEKFKLDADEVTVSEIFGLTMLVHGMRGKGDVIKEVLKRIEGEVPKTLNFGGDPFDDYLDTMRGRTQFQPSAPVDPVTNGKEKMKGDNGANA